HRELFFEQFEDIALFLRKDRDFFHLYFCAAGMAFLSRAFQTLPCSPTERLAADLIGPKSSIANLVSAFEQAGFRKYAHLIRLARVAAAAPPDAPTGPS